MELHLSSKTESRLNELAAATGRTPDQLIEDAVAGYFEELSVLRDTLDRRYDELNTGAVAPVDGDDAFTRLR